MHTNRLHVCIHARVVIDLVCKHVLYEYSGVVFVCSYEGHTTLLARV